MVIYLFFLTISCHSREGGNLPLSYQWQINGRPRIKSGMTVGLFFVFSGSEFFSWLRGAFLQNKSLS